MNTETPFETFLSQPDETAWRQTVAELLPAIHEVDRTATPIWFSFFPLSLWQALQAADDPALLARDLLLQGNYYLKDQIDSSHSFLYGHRYWPAVKQAVAARAENFSGESPTTLAAEIRQIARQVAAAERIEESLLIGITAVALMTLRQVGLAAFKDAPGEIKLDRRHANRSPEQILRARARDDSQGLLGFLRTTDKRWTVVFNENRDDARFQAVNTEEIASAAARDKREWHKVDPRCTFNEGPIPVQCRSASCGTCWVGVLGGAEKLSAVAPREGKKIKEFGYINTDEPKPLIRLACQAQALGAVSVVIPPWNGVFGKYLARRESAAATVEPQAQQS